MGMYKNWLELKHVMVEAVIQGVWQHNCYTPCITASNLLCFNSNQFLYIPIMSILFQC
jgi:hypothetical protein